MLSPVGGSLKRAVAQAPKRPAQAAPLPKLAPAKIHPHHRMRPPSPLMDQREPAALSTQGSPGQGSAAGATTNASASASNNGATLSADANANALAGAVAVTVTDIAATGSGSQVSASAVSGKDPDGESSSGTDTFAFAVGGKHQTTTRSRRPRCHRQNDDERQEDHDDRLFRQRAVQRRRGQQASRDRFCDNLWKRICDDRSGRLRRGANRSYRVCDGRPAGRERLGELQQLVFERHALRSDVCGELVERRGVHFRSACRRDGQPLPQP